MSTLISAFPDGWELRHAPAYGSSRSRRWLPVILANASLARSWGQLRTFRLSWSLEEHRFAGGRFSERLKVEWPALYERVDLFMELHAEEIAAERRRLLAEDVL